jgi:hypothetical protein
MTQGKPLPYRRKSGIPRDRDRAGQSPGRGPAKAPSPEKKISGLSSIYAKIKAIAQFYGAL